MARAARFSNPPVGCSDTLDVARSDHRRQGRLKRGIPGAIGSGLERGKKLCWGEACARGESVPQRAVDADPR